MSQEHIPVKKMSGTSYHAVNQRRSYYEIFKNPKTVVSHEVGWPTRLELHHVREVYEITQKSDAHRTVHHHFLHPVTKSAERTSCTPFCRIFGGKPFLNIEPGGWNAVYGHFRAAQGQKE
jgi:hypothetical protein